MKKMKKLAIIFMMATPFLTVHADNIRCTKEYGDSTKYLAGVGTCMDGTTGKTLTGFVLFQRTDSRTTH